jgi:hypothetical protein
LKALQFFRSVTGNPNQLDAGITESLNIFLQLDQLLFAVGSPVGRPVEENRRPLIFFQVFVNLNNLTFGIGKGKRGNSGTELKARQAEGLLPANLTGSN